MTDVPLPQLEGADVLTHSQRSTYKTCPRKAYFAYELGVRPAHGATPLRIGTAVHLGIDYFAQGVERDDAILRAVASYETLPPWAHDDDAVFEWCVERETVKALLAGYHWRWGADDAVVVATEQSYNLPIRNPDTGHPSRTFRRAGKIDKIVHLADGRMAIREHKTCGEDIGPASDYWRRLEIDEQISEYMLAARVEYAVATVDYDVIRKPGIAPRKLTRTDIHLIQADSAYHGVPVDPRYMHVGDRESPAMFGGRLLADIVKRPDFYLQRREVPRLDSDLEEYQRDLWQVAQQYADSRREGRWFRNTAACRMHGRCAYLSVCRTGIDAANPPPGFERVSNVHQELQEAA